MIYVRVCIICGRSYIIGRQFTCSDKCHEELVNRLTQIFGKYKKIIDAETGRVYKVPIKDILDRGLRYKDLINYPLWEEASE
mgnify:CR=1 FL=1